MRAGQGMHSDDLSGDNPLGLEVYSSDGQLVGRIAGYMEEIEDDTEDIEGSQVDLVDSHGDLIGPRRVIIDGHGYVTQSQIAIEEDQIEYDFKGRRAVLPLTLAQIEQIPQNDPTTDDAPPLN